MTVSENSLSPDQKRYRLYMPRLFNEKHTQPLLYTGMVERTFLLKIQWFDPVIALNCSIFCISKQGKALFHKLHFLCHPYKPEFVNFIKYEFLTV